MAQNEDFAVLVPSEFYNISFSVYKSNLWFNVFINYGLQSKDFFPNQYIDPFVILPVLSFEIGKSIRSMQMYYDLYDIPAHYPEELKIMIEHNEFNGENIVVSSTISKFVDFYKKAFWDNLSFSELSPLGMSILDREENEK